MYDLQTVAQRRFEQSERIVKMWRAMHEEHNDASSRRLLLNALYYGAGTFDTLVALDLADEAMKKQADEWSTQAHELEKAQG